MFNSIHKLSYVFLLSSAFLIENPAQAGREDDNAASKVVAQKVVTDADLPEGLKQARNKLYGILRNELPKNGGVPAANITDEVLANMFDLSDGDEGINTALARLLNGASKRDNAIKIISATRRRYYGWFNFDASQKVRIGKTNFDLSPISLAVRAASLAKLEELNAQPSSSEASSSTSAKNPTPSLNGSSVKPLSNDADAARTTAEAKRIAEEEEAARLKAQAAQNAVKRVTHLSKGYTAENFGVEEIADGYILTAPTTGIGRFWLHQNPTDGATKNGHLVQPLALKKGQTLRVSLEVSDLQKRVEFALVHTAFKQLAMLPITKDGSYTMTFVAPEDMEVTPDIVAKTNPSAFKVSNIKVEIEDAQVIERKNYLVNEADGGSSDIADSVDVSRIRLSTGVYVYK